jgi:hypothetical protein
MASTLCTCACRSNDVNFFPGKRLRWGIAHMINLDLVTNGRR